MTQQLRLIYGSFIHSVSYTEIDILTNHLMITDKNDKIVHFSSTKREDVHQYQTKHNIQENETYIMTSLDEFVIPGFIDCHLHAPQYPNLGIGLNCCLLDWLEKYTHKTESKFIDTQYSTDIYDKLVNELLAKGTTTACYFGSIHYESTLILAQIIREKGQRALVGKVNQTNNTNIKDEHLETEDESILNTIKFIDSIRELKTSLIEPVITPRFALGCSLGLMKKLGKIAKEKKVMIQTHLSESIEEIKHTLNMYKPIKSYTEIYNECNLITKNSVLSHCIHLSNEELHIIRAQNSGIVHCPNSNFMLKSGVFNSKETLKAHEKVGLGTDIAAGTSISIQNAMRLAIFASNALAIHRNESNVTTPKNAFYMATLGGAKTLNLDSKIGRFEPGMELDALIIKFENSKYNIGKQITQNCDINYLEETFERFINIADDRNIKVVVVKGKIVYKAIK